MMGSRYHRLVILILLSLTWPTGWCQYGYYGSSYYPYSSYYGAGYNGYGPSYYGYNQGGSARGDVYMGSGLGGLWLLCSSVNCGRG